MANAAPGKRKGELNTPVALSCIANFGVNARTSASKEPSKAGFGR